MASEKLNIKKTFFINEKLQDNLNFIAKCTGNKEAPIIREAIFKAYKEFKKQD